VPRGPGSETREPANPREFGWLFAVSKQKVQVRSWLPQEATRKATSDRWSCAAYSPPEPSV